MVCLFSGILYSIEFIMVFKKIWVDFKIIMLRDRSYGKERSIGVIWWIKSRVEGVWEEREEDGL